MLNPDKETAVRRFSEKHNLPVMATVLESVGQTPNLVTDEGMKIAGLRTSALLYKASLYKQGVTPAIILEGLRGYYDSVTEISEKPEIKDNKNKSKGRKKALSEITMRFSGLVALSRDTLSLNTDTQTLQTEPIRIQEGIQYPLDR